MVELVRGRIYVDSDQPRSGEPAIEVRTIFGVVQDIGTQFEVRLGESSLRLRVREGRVRLEHGGESQEAEAGEELKVVAGGVTRRSAAVYGPQWHWVQEGAPVPELEGQTLTSFLSWVTRETIEYPESDGEPMAETDAHRDDLAELVFTLKHHFRDQDDVYVSGNLFVYYEKGDLGKRRAPDVFVVLGVPSRQRRTFRLWEEGKPPVMAIELTSKGTKNEDQKEKPKIYAGMGIEYLFLYDVLGEYLTPPLQGLRLGKDGKYHSLVGPRRGPLPCPPLGLDLILDEEGHLQFVDRETGEIVVRTREARLQAESALEQAEEALEQVTAAHRQALEEKEKAEQRNREMMAEIKWLRAQMHGREEGLES